MDAPTPITRVLIVGGTLTAWIAATRLASAFRDTVEVTVLETPHRPTAQVTALAATAQRDLFDHLGIPENVWMRASAASFDAAVTYDMTPAADEKRTAPRPPAFILRNAVAPDCEGFPLTHVWNYLYATGQTRTPVDGACFRETPLLAAGKSPRWLDGRSAFSYGWHADTGMLTHFLRATAVRSCGVRMLTGTLRGGPERAERDEHGMLTALHTTRGTLYADLFLDCTGADRLLITGVLAEPFTSDADHVPTDTAVTLTLPREAGARTVEPYTTVTAVEHGWTWRRPLLDRTGAGLAYAAARTAPDEAARTLLATLTPQRREPALTHTPYRPGHIRRPWAGNCIALGEAASVVDPLAEDHAATLALLDRLVRNFPSAAARETPAARFNEAAAHHHDHAVALTQLRTPTTWQPPRTPTPLTPTPLTPTPLTLTPLTPTPLTLATLDAHRHGLAPTPDELPLRTLLLALTPHTAAPPPALAHHPHALRTAADHFARIERHQRTLLETLPPAHAYLTRLHAPAAATRTLLAASPQWVRAY
ncbi:tryptophan 7-halogenase [Streptomyces sp. NPDC090022]|uniref:tryptophan 7-halogenase n=1 Tax=Streptomyces sp. NPDC090022 TaxID=3365920 RepID=UPI0037FE61C6